jgi:hypothetical protein
MTRLPTKRMATACWDFIVVKTGRLQPASALDFSSLQPANKKSSQQVIHKCLWMSWGLILHASIVVQTGKTRRSGTEILMFAQMNRFSRLEVSAY